MPDLPELDQVVHGQLRLAVLSILSTVEKADFTYLRDRQHGRQHCRASAEARAGRLHLSGEDLSEPQTDEHLQAHRRRTHRSHQLHSQFEEAAGSGV
jgi:hypothetical protein